MKRLAVAGRQFHFTRRTAGCDRPDKPAFLNASNRKNGDGAVFEYAKALGDVEALEPGAVTDPVVWP